MKKILFILLLNSLLFAQVEHSQKNIAGSFLPNFFIDLASYQSQDSGKSKIDVFIKIPYSNVQFLKNNIGYKAKYSIIVSFYDDDDELKIEKLWYETIETENFKQTQSRRSFNFSYKSFVIEPGEYKIVCKLEDTESRKYSEFEQEIEVRKFVDPIEVSDLIILSEFIETKDGLKIIPNISNQVTSKDSTISFFYEIYTTEPKTVKLNYSIKDNEEELKHAFEKEIKLSIGKNEINETLKDINFALGDYKLEVRLFDDNNNYIKGIVKKFSSKIFGFPSSIKDLDLAVKQMIYIASPSDIEKIDETENYSDKLSKYLDYWKQLDPSPNTVENETLNEYYRRVEYADANFGGYFKGWKSDMGMVYITLGAPDQVTRRPYEMDSKPYEVWEYYVLNRSFVFIDQTNFGDYRLYNPAYGDWFRYRP